MPATLGGTHKKLNDGTVVTIRPDFASGFGDLWATVDVVVALIEELDKIFAASQLADFPAFKAALASGRTAIVLDRRDGP